METKPLCPWLRLALNANSQWDRACIERQWIILGSIWLLAACPRLFKNMSIHIDFEAIDRIKRQILSLYRNSIAQYAGSYISKVTGIFDAIPGQLQKHDKKFKFSDIKKEARFRDYDSALFWLSDAQIVNLCYKTTEPNIGLSLNRDSLSIKYGRYGAVYQPCLRW